MRVAVVIAILMSLLSWTVAGQERFNHRIPMRQKSAATFYVDGYLVGFGPVEMMVDTGSSYTTINEVALKALKRRGQARYLHDLSGIMADGSRKVVPIYRLDGLQIGEECFLDNLDVAVFPGDTRFILGLSALRRTSPFVFSMEPPTLILSNCFGDQTAQKDGLESGSAMIPTALAGDVEDLQLAARLAEGHREND